MPITAELLTPRPRTTPDGGTGHRAAWATGCRLLPDGEPVLARWFVVVMLVLSVLAIER